MTEPFSKICIQFGFSTSLNYDRVLSIATTFRTYSCTGEGRKIKHQMTFEPEKIDDLIKLSDLIHDWRSAIYLLNAQEVKYYKFDYFVRCIKNKLEDDDSINYCNNNNPWGCHKIGTTITTGKYDKNGNFHFDKKRFLNQQKAQLQLLSACPYFNKESVLKQIDNQSPVINPDTDNNWTYNSDYREEIDGIIYEPITSGEFQIPEKYHANEKIRHTKLIAINEDEWTNNVELGYLSDIEPFLRDGWLIVNITNKNDSWYCILQRS